MTRRKITKLSLIKGIDRIGNVFSRFIPNFKNRQEIPDKLLMINLGDVSDVLATLPTLQFVTEKIPTATVDYLCGEWMRGLLSGHPSINDVVIYNAPWILCRICTSEQPSNQSPISIAMELRKNSYDAVLSFQPDIRTNFISMLTGASLRLGYGKNGGGFFLTHDLPYTTEAPCHQLHLKMLKVFGIEPEFKSPQIIPTPGDIASTRTIVDTMTPQKPIAVIHPGGVSRNRQWSVDKFNKLIIELYNIGFQSLVIGGPGESKLINSIARDLEIDQMQIWNFPTFGETAALARYAGVYIGLYSGTSHIMAVMGIPTVVILGSRIPTERIPLGSKVRMLYSVKPCKACSESLDASPAESECRCIERIEVSEVMRTVKEIIQTDNNSAD